MTSNEKLKKQQQDLRHQLKQSEFRVQEIFDNLENNFGRIAINSVLPFSTAQRKSMNNAFDSANNFVSKIIPGIGTGKKLEGPLKAVQMVVVGLVYRYIRRLLK